jgi:hypothetical protein
MGTLLAVACTKSPVSGNRVESTSENELTVSDTGDAVDVTVQEREGERLAMRIDATSKENLNEKGRTTMPEEQLSQEPIRPEDAFPF